MSGVNDICVSAGRVPKDAAYQAICSEVARLLRDERLRQKLPLASVAESAGISYQMVGYIEQGKRVPGLETLLRIAHALEIDLGDLIQKAIHEARGIKRPGTPR